MWSVPSRRREPSTAVRMLAGLLSRLPGPPPACETRPNFVARTTPSRRSLMARPTSSSFTKGAVDLSGVEEGDAQVERPMDGAYGLGVVRARAGVGGGHSHGSKSDTSHIECPQVDVLQRCRPFLSPIRGSVRARALFGYVSSALVRSDRGGLGRPRRLVLARQPRREPKVDPDNRGWRREPLHQKGFPARDSGVSGRQRWACSPGATCRVSRLPPSKGRPRS